MNAADQSTPVLTVSTQDFADCRLVRVEGRIEHTNADDFLAQLQTITEGVPEGGGMVVDLGKLEFITSSGLRALFLAEKTLTAAGARMVVAQIKGVVNEVFRISNFDSLLSVAPTVAEAVGQISPSAAEAYSG